jgi:hypothetical protein
VPAAVCTSLTGAHSRPHTARRSGPGHPSRYRRSAPAVVAPALMHGIGRACPVVTAGWISHRSSPPGAASPGVSGCRTPATTGADGRAGGRPAVTAGANQTGAQPRAARCQPGADGRAVPHRPSGPISPQIIKELHLKRGRGLPRAAVPLRVALHNWPRALFAAKFAENTRYSVRSKRGERLASVTETSTVASGTRDRLARHVDFRGARLRS